MEKFMSKDRAIAFSQCKLMRDANDLDPLFCKVILTDEELIILNDELAKRGELLYQIPFRQIRNFEFKNEKLQKKRGMALFLENLLGIFGAVIGGFGFFVTREPEADILALSFIDEQGEQKDFKLDMMQNGEGGLVKEYIKRVR